MCIYMYIYVYVHRQYMNRYTVCAIKISWGGNEQKISKTLCKGQVRWST